MHVADALLQAFPLDIVEEDFDRDIAEERCIHPMSASAHVTDQKMTEIKEHMNMDEPMQQLITQIR